MSATLDLLVTYYLMDPDIQGLNAHKLLSIVCSVLLTIIMKYK